jgi:hypothetical protein
MAHPARTRGFTPPVEAVREIEDQREAIAGEKRFGRSWPSALAHPISGNPQEFVTVLIVNAEPPELYRRYFLCQE